MGRFLTLHVYTVRTLKLKNKTQGCFHNQQNSKFVTEQRRNQTKRIILHRLLILLRAVLFLAQIFHLISHPWQNVGNYCRCPRLMIKKVLLDLTIVLFWEFSNALSHRMFHAILLVKLNCSLVWNYAQMTWLCRYCC